MLDSHSKRSLAYSGEVLLLEAAKYLKLLDKLGWVELWTDKQGTDFVQWEKLQCEE